VLIINEKAVIQLQGGPAKVRPTYFLLLAFECVDKFQ